MTPGTWEEELLSLFPSISILHRPPSWLQRWQQPYSTGAGDGEKGSGVDGVGGEGEKGSGEDEGVGADGGQQGEAEWEKYTLEVEDDLLWRVDVIKVRVQRSM
ncbi:unnamed protein product [Closterium sp. Yama58-4]|nr:unnamed protein product [Closterium sp. Yama58-4]